MKAPTSAAAAVCLAACAVPCPPAASAAATPIVITAGRVAQTAADSLASVTVIERSDIERLQAPSVPALLRSTAGLSLVNSGGAGKLTSVLLRGTESDHVLVLVDGIKIGSAGAGTTAFEHIPVEQIERIEIVRGPRSSLYGSEAIGGVIQIFTRKGGGALKPAVSLGGGSERTLKGSANLSGGGETSWFNLGLSAEDTDGFNACTGEPMIGGCFTREPDEDGYANRSVSLRAGARLGAGVEMDWRFLRSAGDTAYDGDYQNRSDTLQQVFGASLRLAPRADWSLSLNAGRSRDESENFKDQAFSSRFETRRDTLSLQNDLRFGRDRRVSLGIDYHDDRVGGSTAYAVTRRDDLGVFAQYIGRHAGHEWQASLRHDENSQFDGHVTGALAWGYDFGGGPRLTLSYGTAFKAPTFDELYFPYYGNPNLTPETAQSVEASLSGAMEWGNWSLDLFQTDVDAMITFDAASYAPANIDAARIRGLEAALLADFGPWRTRAGLALLDPINRGGGANHGKVLPRRAGQSLNLELDRSIGRFAFGASVNAVGRRYDDVANSRELDAYLTLDLRAEYRLDAVWRLQARLDNLFDADYETAAYYNQPGRSFFVTLRYEP